MKPTVYININGILTWPGSAKNWNGRAVTWIHVNTPHKSEDFEYIIGPLSRRIGQQKRARHLAKMIIFYIDKGWDVVLLCHSNGCNIGERTLKLIGDRRIKEIHFLAPATSGETVLECLKTGQVGKLKIYAGGKDCAMKWAKISQIFRFIGLGCGNLGGKSKEELIELVGAKNVIYCADFKHSTWWNKDIFEATMEAITK